MDARNNFQMQWVFQGEKRIDMEEVLSVSAFRMVPSHNTDTNCNCPTGWVELGARVRQQEALHVGAEDHVG